MLVVRRWTEAGVTTLRCTRPANRGRWMRVGCGMHNGNILALGSPRTLNMLDCTLSVARISATSAWLADVTTRLQMQLVDPGGIS